MRLKKMCYFTIESFPCLNVKIENREIENCQSINFLGNIFYQILNIRYDGMNRLYIYIYTIYIYIYIKNIYIYI